jgi:acetoin utilization deacetylase AcuC-like enzyme
MRLIVAGPTGTVEHDGGLFHPEQQARIFSVMKGIRALGLEDEVIHPPTPKAELRDLARVHSIAYLTELEEFCARGGGDMDPDTFVRADSWNAARRAAGAGLAAIASLEEHGEGVAFVPVRPPGHHAERDRGMGFCLLNNVAIAAASLTARGERVLIVDWDVHHGNGTQSIFWDDPNVLYVSTHEFPLFPGTGRAVEIGGPKALGLTVNIPLPAGATGDVVRAAIDIVARPVIEDFLPDWVLVSCGFDAHGADPLGGFELSSGDFAELARIVQGFTPRPGRLALFLEGGYNQAALQKSMTDTLGALLGLPTDPTAPTSGGAGMDEISAAVSIRHRAEEQARTQPTGNEKRYSIPV